MAYRLLDPVKQKIAIKRNVISDENNFGIGLLNSSYSPSYSDPFDIVEDKGLTVPFMGILTSSSTFVPKSTFSWSTQTDTIRSPNQLSKGKDTSLTHNLL